MDSADALPEGRAGRVVPVSQLAMLARYARSCETKAKRNF